MLYGKITSTNKLFEYVFIHISDLTFTPVKLNIKDLM